MLETLLVAPFMAQADATIANVATPTAASLLCSLAPDPIVLIVARVAQGAGAAMMFPQALTGIQLGFSGAERVRAIGRYAIALSAGAVTGQILGGALISADIAGTGWRSIFFVNVPIGLLLILAARRQLPRDEPRASRRVDLPGVAILSATLVLIVLPLAMGRSEGWPAWVWGCLAASLPALALRARWVRARHAFALVTAAFAACAVLAAGCAHRSTRSASARRSAR